MSSNFMKLKAPVQMAATSLKGERIFYVFKCNEKNAGCKEFFHFIDKQGISINLQIV